MLRFIVLISLFITATTTQAAGNILILGDSISAGYGLEQDQSWTHLLQQKLDKQKFNYQVINASISGDTTAGGLNRLPRALEKHQPKIVIIELGGNDGLRGLPVNKMQQNLQQMIEMSLARNAKVLLLGIRIPPNYGPFYTRQFANAFADLSEKNPIAFQAKLFQGLENRRNYFQSDQIHPTAEAQQILLQNVWQKLKPLL